MVNEGLKTGRDRQNPQGPVARFNGRGASGGSPIPFHCATVRSRIQGPLTIDEFAFRSRFRGGLLLTIAIGRLLKDGGKGAQRTMPDFGSLKTLAMSAVVAVAVAVDLCLAGGASAATRGGFGGCEGWGGVYCDENDVSYYAPRSLYLAAIYVDGPAVVYIPRYYIPRRHVIARHFAPRPVARRLCVDR